MKNNKVVVSLFGLGEITLKNFEVFLCGSLLLKPDMSHMETYPDLFINGVTMAIHDWTRGDISEAIAEIVNDYNRYVERAVNGQERYRKHLATEDGYGEFAERFRSIFADAVRS